MSPTALRVQGVRVSYGDHLALEDVNLEIAPGRIVGLIGPNGAGKTTLFKALVGLLPLDEGRIAVDGKPARATGRQTAVAYVPQEDAVDARYPVTVMDVVLMGRYGHLGWFRWPGAHERGVALRALDRVGMRDLHERSFGALSGGQRQRVFLARALAQDARILLMDEPFTGVDATTQEIIFDVLRELRANGRTLLVATHDLASVRAFCDDVVLINRTIVAHGKISETFTPENLQRTFGGRLVLLEGGARAALDAGAPVHPPRGKLEV